MGEAVGFGVGEAVGLGLGLAVALAVAVATGADAPAPDPMSKVAVPPSFVVSVSWSSATAHVVTCSRPWTNSEPYEPSGQATSVLTPGVIVMRSLPLVVYAPAIALQSALPTNFPSVPKWIV